MISDQKLQELTESKPTELFYSIAVEKPVDPQRARLLNQRRELRRLNRAQTRLRLEVELLDAYRTLYNSAKWDLIGLCLGLGFLAGCGFSAWV